MRGFFGVVTLFSIAEEVWTMQGRIFVYLALFDCRERLSWREDSTWKSDTVLTHISLTRITSSALAPARSTLLSQ